MISPFGMVMRKIRSKSKESLRGMAIHLGISASFLSIMEVGRKQIPGEYLNKISETYSLNEEEKIELSNAINETNGNVEIELTKMNNAQKELSLLFARKINNADPDLIEKLKKVLEESQND